MEARETIRRTDILVVEDQSLLAQAMVLVFETCISGARLHTAANGNAALDMLLGGLRCDLIVCDLQMPGMDGARLIRRLASTPSLSTIPVVLLTSHVGQRVEDLRALPSVKGYFRKPVDLVSIAQKLDAFLAGRSLQWG